MSLSRRPATVSLLLRGASLHIGIAVQQLSSIIWKAVHGMLRDGSVHRKTVRWTSRMLRAKSDTLGTTLNVTVLTIFSLRAHRGQSL